MAGTPKQNITLPVPTKGMQSAYSHYVASPNSWSYLENFDNDELGILTTRSNIYLSDFSQTVESNGIGTNVNTYNSKVLLKVGTSLVWSQTNVIVSSNTIATVFINSTGRARFSQLGSNTYFVCRGNLTQGFNDSSTVFPTSFSFSSNMDLIQAGFSGRFWAGNSDSVLTEIGKLYYSDVINVSNPAATIGGTNFLLINTKGAVLSGLIEHDKILYVFTPVSIFKVYNTQSLDNAPFYNFGAIRQEVIVKNEDSIFFMNPTGIFQLKNESVQKISQDIDDVFSRLNLSNLANNINGFRCSSWVNENSVFFSIDLNPQWNLTGAVDRTYVLKYNINYKQWAVYSFKDFQITDSISYYAPLNPSIDTVADLQPTTFLYGKNLNTFNFKFGLFDITTKLSGAKPFQSGNLALMPQGDWSSSFFGTASTSENVPIPCNAETQWITFGSEVSLKIINGISIASENAAGFTLMYQIDKENMEMSDRNNAKWTTVGDIKDDYITFYRDFESKPFRRIKFKISGTALGLPIKIGEITFLSISNEGYGNN